MGDPSAVLSLYMRRGLYTSACRVVSAILMGHGDGTQARENRAPARLPEKGDIDFVPYDKIDVLWCLVEEALNYVRVDQTTKRMLQEARDTMETAIEKHFGLMKISDLGSRSARALLL